MYLRRLEISGFKSFGSRVTLDFKPGVSAVVGPNGSGKSNIAEAIRWVLGTQNVRDLRARKTEELIYSGADKGKAKASMAEVIMTLEGKPKETELGIEQLIVSRRLYRSGETDYRLSDRPIRIKDLQRILAQAGFGTSSYTVIGQGMIDSLIIASPAERKLLFEEASGIRAFELERIEAVRKIDRAITQAEALRSQAQALEPDRSQLHQQVKQLERKREVTDQLNEYRSIWTHNELQARLETEKDLNVQKKANTVSLKAQKLEFDQLNAILRALTAGSQKTTQRQEQILERLDAIDVRRNILADTLSAREAQLSVARVKAEADDRPASLKREIRLEQDKLDKFSMYLQTQSKVNQKYEAKVTAFNAEITELNAQLTSYRQKLLANQRNEYLKHALGLARLVYKQLQPEAKVKRSELTLALHKLIRMVKLASEADLSTLPSDIAKAQRKITRELSKREEVVESQTGTIIKMRSVELDINAVEKHIVELTARLAAAEAMACLLYTSPSPRD